MQKCDSEEMSSSSSGLEFSGNMSESYQNNCCHILTHEYKEKNMSKRNISNCYNREKSDRKEFIQQLYSPCLKALIESSSDNPRSSTPMHSSHIHSSYSYIKQDDLSNVNDDHSINFSYPNLSKQGFENSSKDILNANFDHLSKINQSQNLDSEKCSSSKDKSKNNSTITAYLNKSEIIPTTAEIKQPSFSKLITDLPTELQYLLEKKHRKNLNCSESISLSSSLPERYSTSHSSEEGQYPFVNHSNVNKSSCSSLERSNTNFFSFQNDLDYESNYSNTDDDICEELVNILKSRISLGNDKKFNSTEQFNHRESRTPLTMKNNCDEIIFGNVSSKNCSSISNNFSTNKLSVESVDSDIEFKNFSKLIDGSNGDKAYFDGSKKYKNSIDFSKTTSRKSKIWNLNKSDSHTKENIEYTYQSVGGCKPVIVDNYFNGENVSDTARKFSTEEKETPLTEYYSGIIKTSNSGSYSSANFHHNANCKESMSMSFPNKFLDLHESDLSLVQFKLPPNHMNNDVELLYQNNKQPSNITNEILLSKDKDLENIWKNSLREISPLTSEISTKKRIKSQITPSKTVLRDQAIMFKAELNIKSGLFGDLNLESVTRKRYFEGYPNYSILTDGIDKLRLNSSRNTKIFLPSDIKFCVNSNWFSGKVDSSRSMCVSETLNSDAKHLKETKSDCNKVIISSPQKCSKEVKRISCGKSNIFTSNKVARNSQLSGKKCFLEGSYCNNTLNDQISTIEMTNIPMETLENIQFHPSHVYSRNSLKINLEDLNNSSESSETDTSMTSSPNFRVGAFKKDSKSTSKGENRFLPVQELFEVEKTISKAVVQALTDIGTNRGLQQSQIVKYIRQHKLAKIHSKFNQEIQKFLKLSTEVGILKKNGSKYLLSCQGTFPLSKRKMPSKQIESKASKKSTSEVRTPISTRTKALQINASKASKYSPLLLRSRKGSLAGYKTEIINRSPMVYKRLRSRVVMLRKNV
ncbi:uncharacterized protein TNCT_310821 [Trichonephila clavata]|uniref:H15 domain-containing protein n=1 Tax=Trichonephila clavata TaxID=2740835 RepID=A0A8X6FDK2_TRICU|nr:uncharacterized protein TNCT_310821 [Trichonephila clavata]